MTEPTPEMIHAARAVVQTRHRVISTLDLVDIVAAALAVDPLRQADTVPVDRDLLREINTYRKSVMFATGPLLALLDRLPDPDQP